MKRREKTERHKAEAAEEPFRRFCQGLAENERDEFLAEALRSADRTKRDGDNRLKEMGGLVFEQYRQIILQYHFRRSRPKASGVDRRL